MLTRSIDLDDPFDLSFEEKLFYNAKRLCVLFAVSALTLSGLDLMNIRPLESAAEFVNEHHTATLADWPRLIRDGIRQISFTNAPSAIVSIPQGILAMAPAQQPSPVAELAAVRNEDAVELAMSAPTEMAKVTSSGLARQVQELLKQSRMNVPANEPSNAPPPSPNSGMVQLASINPGVLPQAVAPQPAATPILLPAHLAVLPPPAPGLPPPSPAQRLKLEGAERARAEHCLANAVYFEARDQPYRGQVAVAQVVINRVFSGVYPHDVCGVIYQNASRHLGCQFTFACDGKRKTINEFGSWARARRIARETLDGQLYITAVGTSTHYHATYVHPNWVHEMHRFAREGIHLFYRPIAWGNGSDEPIWARAQMVANKKK